jgi:hypothetical protein
MHAHVHSLSGAPEGFTLFRGHLRALLSVPQTHRDAALVSFWSDGENFVSWLAVPPARLVSSIALHCGMTAESLLVNETADAS